MNLEAKNLYNHVAAEIEAGLRGTQLSEGLAASASEAHLDTATIPTAADP